MARGFVIQNNFSESETGASDRGILDNLGGVGITDDILLFDGNLRAVSTVKAFDQPTIQVSNFIFTAGGGVTSISANFRVLTDGEEITISGTDTAIDGTYNVNGNPTQTSLSVTPTFPISYSGEATITGEPAANYIVNNDNEIEIVGEGIVPFSEGTLISYGDSDYVYEVVNSDTSSKFSLKDGNGDPWNPTLVDLAADFKNFARSDSITQSDLFNLNTPRPDTGSSNLEGNNDNSEGAPGSGGGEEATTVTSLFDEFTLSEQIAYIQERIALFNYKRGRVPITNKDTTLEANVSFKGGLTITNINSEGNGSVDVYSGGVPIQGTPGLYISGATGIVRAFSDLSNPWEPDNPSATPGPQAFEQGIFTTEDADLNPITDVQCNKLKFSAVATSYTPGKPRFIFNSGDGVVNISAQPININSYTHKLPVVVNGELYYMLMQL